MFKDLNIDLNNVTFGDLYGGYIWEAIRKPGLNYTYEKYRDKIYSMNECTSACTLGFHIGPEYTDNFQCAVPQLYLQLQFKEDPISREFDEIRNKSRDLANEISLKLFKAIMRSKAMRTLIISRIDSFNLAINTHVIDICVDLDKIDDDYLTGDYYIYKNSNGYNNFDNLALIFLNSYSIDDLTYQLFGEWTSDITLLNPKNKGINLYTRFGTFEINTDKGFLKLYYDFVDDFVNHYWPNDASSGIEVAFDIFKQNLFMSFVLSDWWKEINVGATYNMEIGTHIESLISSTYENVVYQLWSKIGDKWFSDSLDEHQFGKYRNDRKLETEDCVNHPAHYENGKYECYEVFNTNFGDTMTKGFTIGNVFKYLWRFRAKNGVEDLKKARWYLDKAIELYSE